MQKRKKNYYNPELRAPELRQIVRDNNAGIMTRAQIAKKFKTSIEHIVAICSRMRNDGVQVRRASWDGRKEEFRIAAEELKTEQRAQRKAEEEEAAKQLRMEQIGHVGAVGIGPSGGAGKPGQGGSGGDGRRVMPQEKETPSEARAGNTYNTP